MSLENKNIFVAGAAGMTGCNILRRILDKYPNAKIKAACHVSEPLIRHRQIEYIQGDLSNFDDCRKIARGCDCAIMAAAAAGGAAFTRTYPWKHMKDNFLMNFQMLEAFQLENVKRVIFIGSAVLYQEFEGSIREDELDLNKEPHQAYFGFAWGMRFLEKLCKFLNQRYGMEIIIVRAANIFGPYDKFNPDVSNFIPAIIRKAVDKMEPFEIWGSPDVTRDVIFIEDFSQAIVLMAENEKIKFEVFNLGSGVKTTVGDAVNWALKYAGHSPSQVKYIQDRPATIKYRALDCAMAKSLLGWKPQYSIEEGVRLTTEWWIKNKDTWKK